MANPKAALTYLMPRGMRLRRKEQSCLGPVDIQMFQPLQKDHESGHHGQSQG